MSLIWGALKAASTAVSFAYAVLMLGRHYNSIKVADWFESVNQVFKDNFAGFEDKIVPISLHEFEVFASGRKNVRYCLCKVDTRPRQDWFTGWVLHSVVRLFQGFDPTSIASFTVRDKLVVELGTTPANTDRFSFVFGRRFRLKGLKNFDGDLGLTLTRVSLPEEFEQNSLYCCLSDSAPAALALAEQPHFAKLLRLLTSRKNDFCSLYISDLMVSERYPAECRRMIRLEIALPLSGDMSYMGDFLRSLFGMVDELAGFKLSEEARTAVKRGRQALENARNERQREMAEEEAKSRREVEAKEKAERIAALTPAERAKLAEKLEKKKGRIQTKVIKH